MKKIKVAVTVLCALALVAVVFASSTMFGKYLYETNTQASFKSGDYTEYYYKALSEKEKQAYTAIKEQIFSFPEQIAVPILDEESLNSVLEALLFDDPYLFMFQTCSLTSMNKIAYFKPDYIMSADEYKAACTLIEKEAASIFTLLPQGEYAQLLHLHDAVINLCTYSDTNTASEADICGVLLNGKAKCSGYAKTLKLLLSKVGIESVLVPGTATGYTGKTVPHLWNAVKIGDTWSYVDATWDDPVAENGEAICSKAFLCMDEEMLRKTHSDFSFTYSCTDSSLYYYNVINAYYSDYGDETASSITKLITNAVLNGQAQVEFKFSNSESFNLAFTELIENEDIYRILARASLHPNVELVTNSIQYRIDLNNNLLTVFFQIKD